MNSQEYSLTLPDSQLNPELRIRLLKYPNVTDVGIGLKMEKGIFTSEKVVVVYVSRKVPLSDLPRNARIPHNIDGNLIDVQEELDPAYVVTSGENIDLTRVRPLRSGIAISTSSASDHSGTLGCFATRNSDQKKVMLSNYHVLFRNRGLLGTDDENKVYQPVEGEHNQVAVVDDTSGRIGGSLDCALAVLSEETSCLCCTHTIPHENKIVSTQLLGVASARVGQKIFKFGAKTQLTTGKVVNVSKAIDGPVDYSDYFLPAGSSFTFSNLIMIVFWDEAGNNFDPSQPFSQEGDSGSVIYNESHEVIGILFGSHFNPDTGRHYSFASHIELVETVLGVTIPGTRNYAMVSPSPISPSLAALDDSTSAANMIITDVPNSSQTDVHLWWQQIRPKLNQISIGEEFLKLIGVHSYEVMRLVNHNREVAITWQRGRGPAFIAAIARSIRYEDYRIPRSIDGMFVTGLAIQMATVLMRHSSEELCEAIRAHLPSFLKVLDRLESARDLCSVVEEIDALQVH